MQPDAEGPAQAGNAVTQGRELVIGVGSSEVLIAAIFALTHLNATQGAAARPHLPAHHAEPLQIQGLGFRV